MHLVSRMHKHRLSTSEQGAITGLVSDHSNMFNGVGRGEQRSQARIYLRGEEGKKRRRSAVLADDSLALPRSPLTIRERLPEPGSGLPCMASLERGCPNLDTMPFMRAGGLFWRGGGGSGSGSGGTRRFLHATRRMTRERPGPWIGAVDQGTTSTRFLVFDSEGQVVALAQRAVQPRFPTSGWVEQDPQELLDTVIACIDEAAAQIERDHRAESLANIKAIGIANQRETTIAWNAATGTTLGPAIGKQGICKTDHVSICPGCSVDGH